jgi:hypothetical protein
VSCPAPPDLGPFFPPPSARLSSPKSVLSCRLPKNLKFCPVRLKNFCRNGSLPGTRTTASNHRNALETGALPRRPKAGTIFFWEVRALQQILFVNFIKVMNQIQGQSTTRRRSRYLQCWRGKRTNRVANVARFRVPPASVIDAHLTRRRGTEGEQTGYHHFFINSLSSRPKNGSSAGP